MISTRNSSRASKASPPRSPVKSRKGVSPSRSPGRPKKSSPVATRSPSRRSPARKSPARKAQSKFPARKSPSRVTKEINEPSKSSTKRTANKSDVEEEKVFITTEIRTSRPRRTEYSLKDLSIKLPFASSSDRLNGIDVGGDGGFGVKKRKQLEELPPRRSSRLKDFSESLGDLKRRVSATPSDIKLTESELESSEEDFPKRKSKSTSRKLTTPYNDIVSSALGYRWEFGGPIGVVLLSIFLPVLIFQVLISCQQLCLLKEFKYTGWKSVNTLFDLKTLAIISAHVLLQAIVSVSPILGHKADKADGTRETYCFNALFAAILTGVAFSGMVYGKIISSKDLLLKYVELGLFSYAFALILSCIMYWKSRNLDDDGLNPYGNTKFLSYDFCIGRELHPKIWKLDIKIWISRICNVAGLILAWLILSEGVTLSNLDLASANITDLKHIIVDTKIKPTLFTTSLIQIFYFLYFIIGESKITSTFSWQSEGVGYIQLVSNCLYPFYFTEISKFLASQTNELSIYVLAGIVFLASLGFWIMVASNRLKHEFRLNPTHPKMSYLEVMPTFLGKRLIVSGFWGTVRHPNYTGDILIHLALGIAVACYGWSLALLPAITGIVLLIHRARRDNARCQRRYGAAWQRYCSKVPKMLIPKVY